MSNLHYKKDGSLDMRYSSSRQAAASASSAAPYSSQQSFAMPATSAGYFGDGLHYKKDGTLDMRYNSSKQAMASSQYSPRPSAAASPAAQYGNVSDGLHYKKDGTLDMRYNSSKQAMASYQNSPRPSAVASPAAHVGDGLHYKKDGTLDMRYNSSKQAMNAGGAVANQSTASITSRLARMKVASPGGFGIPSSVPTKKDGTPDMRTSAAKAWVAQQAAIHGQCLPAWVPRLKDGTINEFSPIGSAYKNALPQAISVQYEKEDDQQRRMEYWARKMRDNQLFQTQFESQMEVDVPAPAPAPSVYNESVEESSELIEIENANELETIEVIGKGGFGVVEKARWRGRLVAVKRLHLDRMTRADTKNFRRELNIARTLHLFQHPNLVATLAFCIQPPLLVMELLQFGSLAFLLHYCEDAEIEVKICDGRIKRNLAYGIADGMRQLHSAEICHRDLKPQNVLITDTWSAKVGDFGLAELRDFTSCTVATENLKEDDQQTVHNPAGTAAYMAPELLNSTKACDYNCDVYSYGILLNELISEEQPYSGQMRMFGGRGPYGAANYASMGNRPTLARGINEQVSGLIKRCWHAEPKCRPKFEEVMRCIEDGRFVIPNGGGLVSRSS